LDYIYIEAHAYILNKNMIKALNPIKWSRPYIFEGNISINILNKFAMFPSICEETITPKEMKAIPIVGKLNYFIGETSTTIIALIETSIIFFMMHIYNF
tara:strand:- start:321 stop:617 length:297 start_codon:yes stop_codon:yes gene_type:complete